MDGSPQAPDRNRTPKKWRRLIEDVARHDGAEGLAACREALTQHPDDPQLHASHAAVLLQLGRAREALAPLARAIELDPADFKSRLRLARTRFRLGELVDVSGLMSVAAALDVTAARLEELGRLLLDEMGDPYGAKEVFKQALRAERTPEREAGFINARDACAALEAQGVDRTSWDIFRRAQDALVADDAAEAERLFAKVVRRSPRYPPAWIGFAGARHAIGRPKRVLRTLDEWAQADPAAAGAIELVRRRPFSRKGLLFDPFEGLPVTTKERALARVGSPEELQRTPNAWLMIDEGERIVEHDPVFSLDPAGADRVTSRTHFLPSFMMSVENPLLIGRGVVSTQAGTVISDINTVHKPEKYHAELKDGRLFIDPTIFNGGRYDVLVHDEPALLCCGPTEDSFGDWITQYPTRMKLAWAAGLDCPVVVSQGQRPQFLQMLVDLGVKPERLIFQPHNAVSLFPRLYAPSWPWVRMRNMDGLYDAYQRLPRRRTEWDGARLYISRKNIRYRPLLNEDEIEALFVERGFRVIKPEELDFRTTVEVFSRPECVAGPYGSAFHNLALCENRPFCFTIMPPFYAARWADEFVRWFGLLGLPLAYVPGEEKAGEQHPTKPWQAPIDKVRRGLDKVVAHLDGARL